MAGRPLSDLDRRRLRQSRRVLLAGLVVAVLAVAATALAGLPGRAGALALLLVTALSLAAAGLHGLVLALVDEAGDRGAAARRLWVGVGLLVVAGVLMAMVGVVVGPGSVGMVGPG